MRRHAELHGNLKLGSHVLSLTRTFPVQLLPKKRNVRAVCVVRAMRKKQCLNVTCDFCFYSHACFNLLFACVTIYCFCSMGSNELTSHLFFHPPSTPNFCIALSAHRLHYAPHQARTACTAASTHCSALHAVPHIAVVVSRIALAQQIRFHSGSHVLSLTRTFPVQLLPKKRNVRAVCVVRAMRKKQCLDT